MSMRIITKSVLFCCSCWFFMVSLFADGPLKCETDASLQSKIKKIVEEVKLLPKDQLKLPPEEMAVFLKNIQTLSAGMSQDEVKRLLGAPDREYTMAVKSTRYPDTITTFDYQQLVTRKPDPYYCISIMFSNRQQKIFAVLKITNIPRFVERNDFIGLERNQVIEEIWKRQGTDGTGKRRILIGIDTGFRIYDSPDE